VDRLARQSPAIRRLHARPAGRPDTVEFETDVIRRSRSTASYALRRALVVDDWTARRTANDLAIIGVVASLRIIHHGPDVEAGDVKESRVFNGYRLAFLFRDPMLGQACAGHFVP